MRENSAYGFGASTKVSYVWAVNYAKRDQKQYYS